jgi:hypothetical protein
MSYAYAVTNLLASENLGTELTNDEGDVTNGAFSNDGRMDKRTTFSTASAAENLYLSLSAAKSIAGFAFLNHNFATLGDPKLAIFGSTHADFSSPVQVKAQSTLVVTDPKKKDHVLQFPAASYRYWILELQWSAGSPALALGELFAYSGATQLSRGSIWGSGEREEQKNAVFESYNGNTFAYSLGGPIRSKELLLADWTQSQLAEIQALWRAVKGEATPFLWIEDYESTATAASSAAQECIYGRLTDVDVFDWANDDFSIYQPPKVRVRSLGREIGS